ncbi:MAG: hypothetical protein K2Q25_11675 [Mycobacteriaceae bacterium]|nr:hypothetical protein [Mycobacteriaceae bacterium]
MYVEAAEILATLLAVGQQFAFADNSDFGNGENLASSMTSAGSGLFTGAAQYRAFAKSAAPKKVRFGEPQICEIPECDEAERLARNAQLDEEGSLRPLKPAPTKDEVAPLGIFDDPSAVILMALAVVQILELMTGFGPAHEGDALTAGADKFDALAQQWRAMCPDSSWHGSSAQAFSDRISEMCGSAQNMADLDHKLAIQVKNQADWVTHISLGFGILTNVLVAAYLYVQWLLYDPKNILFSLDFARLVAYFGIVIAIGMIVTLACRSGACAEKVDRLAREYEKLHVYADSTGVSELQRVSVFAGVTVPRGGKRASGAWESSTLPALPDIATLARLAGSVENVHAPLDTQATWFRAYGHLNSSPTGKLRQFGAGTRQDLSAAALATRLQESSQVPAQLSEGQRAPIEVMLSGEDKPHESVGG